MSNDSIAKNRFFIVQSICSNQIFYTSLLRLHDLFSVKLKKNHYIINYCFAQLRVLCTIYFYTKNINANFLVLYHGPVNNEVNCESYERECARLTCDSIVRSSAPGGCESCTCADTTPPCQQFVEECERISCPYGVRKVRDNGCERQVADMQQSVR